MLSRALLCLVVTGALGAAACGDDLNDPPVQGAAGSSAAAGSAGETGASPGGSSGNGAGAAASGGTGGELGGTGATAGAGEETGGVGGETGADDAGAGGAAGQVNEPVGPCDPLALEDGCVLNPRSGIYVTPNGDDDADGSRAEPLASVKEAVARARAMREAQPIYVCTATYTAPIEITTDGIAIHGGFACPESTGDAWVFDSAERARLAPDAHGVAVRIRDADGVTLSDLTIAAVDAVGAGESSVAVFVANSRDVRFERVSVVAGDGADGADGEYAEYAFSDDLDGNDFALEFGAEPRVCECAEYGVTAGGGGGNSGSRTVVADNGAPNFGGGSAGQLDVACNAGGDGEKGADAPPGADGEPAWGRGTLDASGWHPSAGRAGVTGAPGQGGGGGAGVAADWDGGGGGGACGGCGGRGGAGGKGGGASVAIVAFASDLTIVASELHTGSGADGGNGADGQLGQPGGNGAPGASPGCAGGNGGQGGLGGTGAGGSGGVTAGVLWRGELAPALLDTTFDLGRYGDGGLSGNLPENDGLVGRSESVMRVE